MDKGFIHVLEAILVSLILLVSVPFLLNPGAKSEDWDLIRLKYFGEDILSTLDRIESFDSDGESDLQDIMERKSFEIDDLIFGLTQRTGIGYNMHTDGGIKNEIRVGCNCTEGEAIALEEFLGEAKINDRIIEFRVFGFDYKDLSRLNFDVILIDGTDQLNSIESFYNESEVNKNLIKNHLKTGGIVEFVDLNDPTTDLQKEIFGLESGGGGGGDITFENKDSPENPNYYIQKYFYGSGISLNYLSQDEITLILRNLDHETRVNRDAFDNIESVSIDVNRNNVFDADETFNEGDQFSIIFGAITLTYSIEEIENLKDIVYLNIDSDDYQFHQFVTEDVNPINVNGTIVVSAGSKNGAILNTEMGRSVWISRSDSDDVIALAKTSILWAAKEEWGNIIRTVSSKQAGVSYIVSQGEEIYEPYIVHMNLWNLF